MTARTWVTASGIAAMALCTLISAFVLERAFELPFLAGSGAAQADFELFMTALILGIPATLLSAGLLGAVAIDAFIRHSVVLTIRAHPVFLALGLLNVFASPSVLLAALDMAVT